MHIILYNGEALKKYRAGKRKKVLLAVLGVVISLLLACVCVFTVLGHWTDVGALFKEEETHEHSWNAWNTAIVKEASCAEDGLVLHACEGCEETKSVFLPAYGHELVGNVCVDCGERASEGLQFMLYTDEDDNGYAVITGIGTCFDREIIIPNVIGGLPVTEIAENAFKGNLNIYGVSIPKGVKKIGRSAFADCKNLYTILLPQGIEELGVGAFNYTAYYNDKKNWDEQGGLYRQGYFLEAIHTTSIA